MSVTDWSPQPSGNALADRAIPARDGMAGREFPEAIRGLMAKAAALALDQGGALVSAGSGNVYEVATNSGFAQMKPGVSVSFRADRANTAEAFLAIDGIGPRRWLDVDGTSLDVGEVKDGQFYTVVWVEAGPNGSPVWQTVGGTPAALAKDVANSVPRNFAAGVSPFDTNAYGSVHPDGTPNNTGKAAMCVVSSDPETVIGKERYVGFFSYNGPGTGDAAVIGSSFSLGACSVKQHFEGTTVRGQMIGANIVVRGGYHGADANSTMPDRPEFGGYNPAGDTTAVLANIVNTSEYAQNAILEAVAYTAKNGAFSAAGNLHSMNVQLGAMRLKNPDGTEANPGIGVALSALNGVLGYAFQANNTARPGSFGFGVPGIWTGFLRYNFDDGGTRAPYDAFRVDQDGTIYQSSGGAVTPSKRVRVGAGGSWEILNHAGQIVLSLTDAGVLRLGTGNQLVQTVPGAWTAYSGALQFDNGSTAAGTFSGRYEVVGKKVTLTVTYSISAAGGAPGGALYVPLPAGLTVGVAAPGVGNEFAINGKMLNVRAFGSATRLTVINYDNTSPVATGAQGQMSLVFEMA